jgi:hypothetical protein
MIEFKGLFHCLLFNAHCLLLDAKTAALATNQKVSLETTTGYF